MPDLHELHKLGQSTWLNYMRRDFIQSGGLRQRIEQGIQGITVNADAFEKSLIASTDYDEAIKKEVSAGTPAQQIHETLMVDDVQRTADFLHRVHEESKGIDGFASLELNPAVLHNATKIVAEAKHITARLDRGNVMIEVPATPTGIDAIQQLIGDGICINATHIFSIAVFEEVARAYIEGLTSYFQTHSVWRISPQAVASFSLSTIDDAVDKLLLEKGCTELIGKTAVSMAKLLYGRFCRLFSGPHWEKLAGRGASPLRPKWTRTNPSNFTTPDTRYIDVLIGPDTVMTFTPLTLNAFLDHGHVSQSLTENVPEAEAVLADIANAGIDLAQVSQSLQRDYLTASDDGFQSVIRQVVAKRDKIESAWQPVTVEMAEADKPVVKKVLEKMCNGRVMSRIWANESGMWSAESHDQQSQMSWLHYPTIMKVQSPEVQKFADQLTQDGIKHCIFLGEPPVNQVVQLFDTLFGKPSKPITLPHAYATLSTCKLSSWEDIQEQAILSDPAETLYLINANTTNGGSCLANTKTLFAWVTKQLSEDSAGQHFALIAPPNNPLVTYAHRHQFRHHFVNGELTSNNHALLSFTGMVPTAILGGNIRRLLRRAEAMACNSETCHPPVFCDNHAAQLGALLANVQQLDIKDVHIVVPQLYHGFALWLKDLLAKNVVLTGIDIHTTGKNSLANLTNNHNKQLILRWRFPGDKAQDDLIKPLAALDHVIVTQKCQDGYDIIGQVFLWQMATAVSTHLHHDAVMAERSIRYVPIW